MENNNIGKIIYVKMKALGYTQETFGALVGVSRSAVSKWINNICEPDQDKYPAIKKILGIDLWDYKFASENKQTSTINIEEDDRFISNRYIVFFLTFIALILDIIFLSTLKLYLAFLTWFLLLSICFFPFESFSDYQVDFKEPIFRVARGLVLTVLVGFVLIVVAIPVGTIIKLL